MPALSVPLSPLRPLRMLTRAVTYTRWLHMLIGSVPAMMCSAVFPGWIGLMEPELLWVLVLPLPLLWCVAVVPEARLAEGLQARLMLLPGPHARYGRPAVSSAEQGGFAAAPSASWADRRRTALWLMLRHQVGCAVAWLSVVLTTATTELLVGALGGRPQTGLAWLVPAQSWLCALFAPLALASLMSSVVAAGAATLVAARRLLGPSPAELLAAAEERTERMLERSRLAGELHDSIGHALTLSVVQAGAARAAGSADFTERALAAIETSGREALEDLERVLRLLREDAPPAGQRPGLTDVGRLLSSARAAGAPVTARMHGPLDALPGPASREGYRMVQEALTNVLRHAGPVPVTVHVEVQEDALELEIRSALPEPLPALPDAAAREGRCGSGLRGIRERAAMLGGRAETGPDGDEWQVRARLPLAAPTTGNSRPREVGKGEFALGGKVRECLRRIPAARRAPRGRF